MSDSARAANADFADKLLSAMRYQFGGHLEKSKGNPKWLSTASEPVDRRERSLKRKLT